METASMARPHYSIERFSLDAVQRVLTTFASDLGLPPGRWPTGFHVEHHGRHDFTLQSFDRNADGDVRSACYREKGGGTLGWLVTIFND